MWLPKNNLSKGTLSVTHSCSCTLSCGTRRCGCRKIGLNCTETCKCSNCQNNKGAGNYGQNIDEVINHICNCTLPCGNNWCHCRRYGLHCIESCGCIDCINDKKANRCSPKISMPVKKLKATEPIYLNIPSSHICKCTTACETSVCGCKKNGKMCTESCKCINCKNGQKELFFGQNAKKLTRNFIEEEQFIFNSPNDQDCRCFDSCNNKRCYCRRYGLFCSTKCKCIDCKNIKEAENDELNISTTVMNQICNCTVLCDSKCDCKNHGKNCTETCKCIECKNDKNVEPFDLNINKGGQTMLPDLSGKVSLSQEASKHISKKEYLNLPDDFNCDQHEKNYGTAKKVSHFNSPDELCGKTYHNCKKHDLSCPEDCNYSTDSGKILKDEAKITVVTNEKTQRIFDNEFLNNYYKDYKFNKESILKNRESIQKLIQNTKTSEKSTMTEYSSSSADFYCKCISTCGYDTCDCRKFGLLCMKNCKCICFRKEKGIQCDLSVLNAKGYNFSSRIMFMVGILPLIIIGFVLLFQSSESNLQIGSETQQNMLNNQNILK